MYNVLLTGIGGQGTVLAAKLLAQAAMSKGWKVRTAETIGMAQRGGSVVSHVRMGNEGEEVHEPLISQGKADLVIAFEPAEAARVLPYLSRDGLLVTAQTPVQPVTAALSKSGYRSDDIMEYLTEEAHQCIAIDDAALCDAAGSKKVLNTILLACALQTEAALQGKEDEGKAVLSVDDVRQAIRDIVKPRFIDLNLKAIEIALGRQRP